MGQILIVDDDHEHAFLTAEKLKEKLKIDVKQVLTAEECLDCVESENFDLLLLDLALPKMNGLELMRRLREKETGVPVIMVTGQGSEKIAVEAMKLGARDYLIKNDAFWMALPLVVKRVLTEEDARLRQKELEARDAELTQLQKVNELAVTLSHSINSPLSIILSNADVLLKQIRDSSQKEPLEKISSAGRKISEITFKLSHLIRPVMMNGHGEEGNPE